MSSTASGQVETPVSHAPSKRDAPQDAGPSRYLGYLAVSQHPFADTRCLSPKGWYYLRCVCGTVVWRPMRCRHCEGCDRHRRNLILAKIMTGVRGQDHVSFLNLTSLPQTTWPEIMTAWTSLLRSLRRNAPELTFAAVKEEGEKTGMKHLHIIITGLPFTPWEAISDQWKRLTGAHHIYIEWKDTMDAVLYAAKHAWKARVRYPKSVTFAKNWPKLPRNQAQIMVEKVTSPPVERRWRMILPDGSLVETLIPGCNCFPEIREHIRLTGPPRHPLVLRR